MVCCRSDDEATPNPFLDLALTPSKNWPGDSVLAIRRTFGPVDGVKLPCLPGKARTEYVEPPTGLRLRVSHSGARSWGVAYWSPAAKTARRQKLGDALKMPLKAARRAARLVLQAVEQEGRDPYVEKLALREKEANQRKVRSADRAAAVEERKRRATTFARVCEKFIEWRRTSPGGKHGKEATARSIAAWQSILRLHVVPVIGDRLPDSLTREDIVDVLEQSFTRGGRSMPRNVLGFLSAVWSWMSDRTRMLGVRLPSVSPLVGLPQIGEKRQMRERVLSPAEIGRLWKATDGDHPACALRFMLLTACRAGEAAMLPWSEIDMRAKTWTLPAERNKSARERIVPLSPQAMAVLKAARAVPGDYVFGGRRAYEFTPRIRERMKTLDSKAFADWQPRDLRRTAATRCALLGADPFVVSLVLDHSKVDPSVPAVTSTYLRSRYEDRVREALFSLGEWIEETVSTAS